MKYLCLVCGYIYDESLGQPEKGYPAGTPFDQLPDDWKCPVCTADKSVFVLKPEANQPAKTQDQPESQPIKPVEGDQMVFINPYICSNLAKNCEKQFRMEEMALFNNLSQYLKKQAIANLQPLVSIDNYLTDTLTADLSKGFALANAPAKDLNDRGAKRALKWAEAVSNMVKLHMNAGGVKESDRVFVCDICGYVHIGPDKPDICPVCKVPNQKIFEIAGGVS